jgi:hypothetical protein
MTAGIRSGQPSRHPHNPSRLPLAISFLASEVKLKRPACRTRGRLNGRCFPPCVTPSSGRRLSSERSIHTGQAPVPAPSPGGMTMIKPSFWTAMHEGAGESAPWGARVRASG